MATGIMAGIAGGYAFYTIFEPRGSAIESEFHLGVTLTSMVFGVLWGLMIFNLDRFIVSSTGKGDGTEAITMEELKGALPRLVMGAIIALTISKPVEIRMFKSEIDAALHERQLELRKEYEQRTRLNYEDRIALVDEELGGFEDGRQDLLARIKKQEQEYNDQLQGRAGAGAGNGPLSRALKAQLDKLERELEKVDVKSRSRIEELLAKRGALISEMDEELAKNKEVASGLDGLLERIKLAHEIAGFWISLFITLLFMAIELTPIFFKLMLIKSPYDYLKDNIEELMKADEGIYVQYNYHKDKQGMERDLIQYLKKDKQIAETRALLKTQDELSEYALRKYKEEMKARIDQNPEAFVSISERQNGSTI